MQRVKMTGTQRVTRAYSESFRTIRYKEKGCRPAEQVRRAAGLCVGAMRGADYFSALATLLRINARTAKRFG